MSEKRIINVGMNRLLFIIVQLFSFFFILLSIRYIYFNVFEHYFSIIIVIYYVSSVVPVTIYFGC